MAVLLIGAWEVFDVEIDGRRIPFGAPEHEALLREELSRALEVLGAGRTQVVVLTTPCFHHFDDAEFRDGSERNDPVRVAWVNRLLAEAVAARGPDARLVDLSAIVCPGGHFTSELGGVPLRLDDGVHFDVRGTPLVWEALLPDVLDAAQESVGTTTAAGAVEPHRAEGVSRAVDERREVGVRHLELRHLFAEVVDDTVGILVAQSALHLARETGQPSLLSAPSSAASMAPRR